MHTHNKLNKSCVAAFPSGKYRIYVLDKATVAACSGAVHMAKEQQAGGADGVWDLLFWKPVRRLCPSV